MSKLVLLDPTKTGKQAEDLENRLHHSVVGQDEAIHQIVRAYQTHVAGLSPVGRPIGNFLFLGPTGSGKTRIVEATAESLLKNSRAVIKIDCAEFQHSHEIAKLIGSPPGYLGHRETHALLSQAALNQHHTDTTKGFHVPSFDEPSCNGKLSTRISRTGVEAARRKFTPEFINRLDKIVVFRSLGEEELRRIVDIELGMVQQRIQTAAASKPFLVNVTDSAKEFLLMEGTDFRYGARHLKRAIERLLVQPLSNLVASGQIHRGDCIRASHEEGSAALLFGREREAVQACGMASRAA
jgi:ATP-dependent Clp protease ATP-binding subunit ClpA